MTNIYDEFEMEVLFIEKAQSIVSDCDSIEELKDKMEPHNWLMSELVIPSHQAITLADYIDFGLTEVYNNYWEKYNDLR